MQMLTSGACITYNQNAGGCNRMLKVLLHGSCSYDCAYCPVRADRSGLAFAPRELAETFLGLYRKNLTGGLFLTSGIPYDTDDVMGELIESARILRTRGLCRIPASEDPARGTAGGYLRSGAVRGPDQP